MKNKKIATLIFTFIILGVFYFIYQAITSESSSGPSEQVEKQINQIDQMQNQGVQDFVGTSLDGNPFHLNTVRNKIVILNFWASWCGPCVQEFPSLIKKAKQSNGEIGLIAVSLDTDEQQMTDFLKSYDVKAPNIYLLKDPQFELAQKFGTEKLPESYILDSQRKLVKKISGAVDWSSDAISTLLGGVK